MSCCVCFVVSSVGFEYCDAMALIGHNSVLSTAIPNENNLLHTRWMNLLTLASSIGAEEDYVAY